MLDFLLNHSPAFIGGELLLGLSLALFGVAFANTVRERYAIRVPVAKMRGLSDVQSRPVQPAE